MRVIRVLVREVESGYGCNEQILISRVMKVSVFVNEHVGGWGCNSIGLRREGGDVGV